MDWQVLRGIRVYGALELEVYFVYLFLLEKRKVEYHLSRYDSTSYTGLFRENHSNGVHRMRHLNYEAMAQKSGFQSIMR